MVDYLCSATTHNESKKMSAPRSFVRGYPFQPEVCEDILYCTRCGLQFIYRVNQRHD